MSFFADTRLEYLMALCNTKVVVEILKIVAPTLHCQCGDVANIPVIIDAQHNQIIINYVTKNIELSQVDWDCFETSWDFKKHPLV